MTDKEKSTDGRGSTADSIRGMEGNQVRNPKSDQSSAKSSTPTINEGIGDDGGISRRQMLALGGGLLVGGTAVGSQTEPGKEATEGVFESIKNFLSGSSPDETPRTGATDTPEKEMTENPEQKPTNTPKKETTDTPTEENNSESTPEEPPTFNPEMSVSFSPNPVRSWTETEIKEQVETDLSSVETSYDIRIDGPEEEISMEDLSSGDQLFFETWGEAKIEKTAETQQETKNKSKVTQSTEFQVYPKPPEGIEQEESFFQLYDQLKESDVEQDELFQKFTYSSEFGGGYENGGKEIFQNLTELMAQEDTDLVTNLAAQLSTTEVTKEDSKYIEAVDESADKYVEALEETENALNSLIKYDELKEFEKELYDFEGILEGVTAFKVDESEYELRQELFDEFKEIRDNLLDKGHLTENDIEYLREASEIIEEREYIENPRYEKARDQNWTDTGDEITDDQVQELREINEWSDPADLYSDEVKENVIGIDPGEDVVLVETTISEEAHPATEEQMQSAINEIKNNTGLNVILNIADDQTENYGNIDEWKNEVEPKLDELSERGMHHLHLNGFTKKSQGQEDSEYSANYAIVDTKIDEYTEEIDYDTEVIGGGIKHELGHAFGITDDPFWVDKNLDYDVEDAYKESIMTYNRERDRFIGDDVEIMRDKQYAQGEMSMKEIERWAEEGTTLRDQYDEVYTPEGVELNI